MPIREARTRFRRRPDQFQRVEGFWESPELLFGNRFDLPTRGDRVRSDATVVAQSSDMAGQSDGTANRRSRVPARTSFVKTYSPDYVFPSSGTVAFEADEHREGFTSLGILTVQDRNGSLGGLSCGSTTVVLLHPLTVAICVSYAPINERYAPRASLELFAAADRFGCGAPIYRKDVIEAIDYLGNVSRRADIHKIGCCGLTRRQLGSTTASTSCRCISAVELSTACH
jgi:hypothetical protein